MPLTLRALECAAKSSSSNVRFDCVVRYIHVALSSFNFKYKRDHVRCTKQVTVAVLGGNPYYTTKRLLHQYLAQQTINLSKSE